MEVKVVNNFLPDDDFNEILSYCKNATYSYGEIDGAENAGDETFCVGMTHQIFPMNSKIVDLFEKECKNQFPEVEGYIITEMYVNCFAPSENPYFHIDSFFPDLKSYTCIFYANDKWNLDDEGETQFYVNDIIYGVPPEPNRMVLFDGRIPHRATSFRNRHRFSVAIKYNISGHCDS
jgi:hypothetical protein